MRILVIYYSFEGNTRFIAENIQAATAGEILELRPKNEVVPSNFMKYFWGGKQVFMKEKPELLPLEKEPQDYDLIFLGTPVWAWTCAPAINAFLAEHKLSGKKFGLFCCHGGQKGKSLVNMQNQLAGNDILGQIDFQEPLKNDKELAAATAREWAQALRDKLTP